MKVYSGDCEYEVSFEYERHPSSTVRSRTRITVCHILIYDNFSKDMRPVESGRSMCHIGDQFCKATGRKIAMRRALTSAFPLDRGTRRAVWTEYWKHHRKPR